MSFGQRMMARLWWGPLRRPFEAVARRTVGRSSRIFSGPIRNVTFDGGLAQMLGIYEIHIQNVLRSLLGQGDILYDVGANTGFFTAFGSKVVGTEGHVYAFEPLPRNIDRIRGLIRDNRLSNCTLVPKAVARKSGASKLYIDGLNAATPSLTPNELAEYIVVTTTSLDEFVAQNRWPQVIKLDIEGAETACLLGAESLVTAAAAPAWIVEIHSQENDLKVIELFRAHGYNTARLTVWKKTNTGYPYHIIAKK